MIPTKLLKRFKYVKDLEDTIMILRNEVRISEHDNKAIIQSRERYSAEVDRLREVIDDIKALTIRGLKWH